MRLIFLLTSIVFINFCENKKSPKNFSILTNKKIFIPGDTLKISLENNNHLEFDSISYFKDDKKNYSDKMWLDHSLETPAICCQCLIDYVNILSLHSLELQLCC